MSDIGSLVERLVDAGLSVAEAGEIIATAFAAGVASSVYRKSPGALRQEKWRERLKASQRNASETPKNERVEASQSVSNRLKASQRDAASLSKEEKKEEIKLKRESARASQIPTAWRPDDPVWNETVEILGSQQRAEYELKKFTDHALEKGRTAKNWNAAWRNWARRSVEYGGRNGHGVSQARTVGAAGSTATGADTILAGMGRIADRIAARKLAERQDSLGPAGELDLER